MRPKRKTRPAPWTLTRPAQPAKVRRPVRRVSLRQAERLRLYRKAVRLWKKKHPFCQVCIDLKSQPIRKTDDPHHRRGRGKYLLDEKTWLPVCRQHHEMIHRHPAWATLHCYMESRLKTWVGHFV